MKIENVFKSVQSYEKLCEIAEKSELKISFWGSEYIVVKDFEGSLSIDAITKRLFELIRKNYEFNESNRDIGKRIAYKINSIYDKSDEILKTCNLFTKILVFLRGLFGLDISWRNWELYEEKNVFEYYTRSQFNKVFGYFPEEAKEKGFRLGEVIDTQHRWRIMANPSN